MIIRKYQAETEGEAVLKAKADLGGDAVVMNMKTIKPRGLIRLFKKPYVEITAALDDEKGSKTLSALSSVENTNTMAAAPNEGQSKDGVVYKPSGVSVSGGASGADKDNPILRELERRDSEKRQAESLEEKLSDIQKLLKQRLDNDTQKTQEEQEQQAEAESEVEMYTKLVYNKLLEQEIDEKYANQIIDEIDKSIKQDAGLDYVLSTVYQKMILKLGESKPITLDGKQPKVVFFIGPTGVGKTTTIAKIASKFTLEEKKKVAMLTADTYRIAATQQLETYAKILNIPFKIIYTPEEIEKSVEEYSDYDLIVVDTAGHSHQNEQQLSDIKKLLDSVGDEEQKEIYLVLSATTKYKDMLSIADSYQGVEGFKLIFTKLDETTCLGSILNLKLYTEADLSYLTCGQNVPDDIEKLDAQRVVKQLLGGG